MSELDPTKLDKLKVAELQDELRSRGLDTKGKKAVLISRLKKALKGGDHNASSQSIDTSMDGDADTSQSLDESSQEAGESQQSSQEEEPQEPAPVETVKPVPEEVPEDDKPVVEEVAPSLSETEEPDAEPEADQVPADESESANDQPEDDVAPFEEPVQEVKEEDSPEEVKEEPKEEENSKPVEMPVTEQEDQEESKPEDDQMDTDQAVKHEADEGWEANQEEKMEPDQTETKHEPEEKVNENGVKMEEEEEEKPDHDNDRGEKRQRSRSKSRSKSRSRSRSPRERRGRRRSRSKSHEREKSNDRSSEKSSEKSKTQDKKKFRPRSPIEPEDDTWKEWTHVSLDKYNSDLFLKISKNGLCGKPATDGGFAMIWAGARASYGVKGGKVAYQVKLTENLEVEHLEADEANPHVLRVGWSTDDNNMLLGEEELSYGYGGTGKASTNLNFVDYGEQFTVGDVITAYLNLESDPCVISYEKNGTDLGTCFEVEKTKLGDKAMFPHVLTKNTAYECNFGAMEEPYFPIKEDYVLMDKVAVEERVKGTGQPENKIDCEIIMMVGLPASGKTTWVEKYNADNPNAKFNILGTNFIIDKMKVMGLPRKRNYAGRWDVLIDKSTKCLNRMLEIASKRKRNYIVDQTNVYASARRRKMQPFEGFSRRAVVVVPTDEDYKTRLESQQKVEGKEVPEKAIYEMKANFTVPDVGMLFDEVEFPELQKEEAEKLVEKYREEGQKNLPLAEPPAKRFKEENGGKRDRDRGSRWSDNTDRHSSTGSGGSRDGGGGRDSRGGKSWGGGGRDSRGGGGGGRWGGPDGGRDGGRWGGGGGGRWDGGQGGGRWGEGGGQGGGRWGEGGGQGGGRWGGGGGGGRGRWNDEPRGGGGGRWGGDREENKKPTEKSGGRNDRGDERSRSGDRWGGGGGGRDRGGGGGYGGSRDGGKSSWGGGRGGYGGGGGGSYGGSSSGGGGGYNKPAGGGGYSQSTPQSYQSSGGYGNQGWNQGAGATQQWGQTAATPGQQAWGQQATNQAWANYAQWPGYGQQTGQQTAATGTGSTAATAGTTGSTGTQQAYNAAAWAAYNQSQWPNWNQYAQWYGQQAAGTGQGTGSGTGSGTQ
ncbi:heterogeneous nuclear ribonucleoprotein U-like isoform X3 [Dreissena polymorpha]|uniref:heterogeneous nuclear ribonucleoprotein U-like isoform X3 n=1 Tax=Dreissena polymorpha TaxID=45954 RepID=UPI002264FC55|nr:heterogeneous nuclear ribonucleoprotein U-like isoform X3 [Dreissena polymorpha]